MNVLNLNDPATRSFIVAGTGAEGETLTTDSREIDDEDGMVTASYKWYLDGTLINGENSSELALK